MKSLYVTGGDFVTLKEWRTAVGGLGCRCEFHPETRDPFIQETVVVRFGDELVAGNRDFVVALDVEYHTPPPNIPPSIVDLWRSHYHSLKEMNAPQSIVDNVATVIAWFDGRADAVAAELERIEPRLRADGDPAADRVAESIRWWRGEAGEENPTLVQEWSLGMIGGWLHEATELASQTLAAAYAFASGGTLDAAPTATFNREYLASALERARSGFAAFDIDPTGQSLEYFDHWNTIAKDDY